MGFTTDNELSDVCHYFSEQDNDNLSTTLRTISNGDLIQIQTINQRELEARRGFALLRQTEANISDLKKEYMSALGKIQLIRETSNFELERRTRVKMMESGTMESLSPFISRVLLGSNPPPLISKHDNKPKEKSFFLAKVASGKIIAVRSLNFDIPAIYYKWVTENLKEHGLHNGYTISINHTVSFEIARVYYKLGFKHGDQVIGYYRMNWYPTSWNHGWILKNAHTFKASELIPVD